MAVTVHQFTKSKPVPGVARRVAQASGLIGSSRSQLRLHAIQMHVAPHATLTMDDEIRAAGAHRAAVPR